MTQSSCDSIPQSSAPIATTSALQPICNLPTMANVSAASTQNVLELSLSQSSVDDGGHVNLVSANESVDPSLESNLGPSPAALAAARAPPASALSPAPPPPLVYSAKLELEVPDGAVAGDRLHFHTQAGQFSLRVPSGAMPGKRMMVTMPVSRPLPADSKLRVTRLHVNGQLQLPKATPEHSALLAMHRAGREAHWSRYAPSERSEIQALCNIADFVPAVESNVPQVWGLWPTKRQCCQVDKARSWEVGRWYPLHCHSFQFAGGDFELILAGAAVPWQVRAAEDSNVTRGKVEVAAVTVLAGSGSPGSAGVTAGAESGAGVAHDVELRVSLRRLSPEAAGGGRADVKGERHGDERGDERGALPLWLHLEVADRWSEWQRTSLGPNESFDFDLGDRRRLHSVRRWWDSALPVTLRVTRADSAALRPGWEGRT
uniref:Uncharacterized protein n=1 Tax=Chrysotila carterae TaxID=13221 RepID=A0A7S4ETE2_CHRCT